MVAMYIGDDDGYDSGGDGHHCNGDSESDFNGDDDDDQDDNDKNDDDDDVSDKNDDNYKMIAKTMRVTIR